MFIDGVPSEPTVPLNETVNFPKWRSFSKAIKVESRRERWFREEKKCPVSSCCGGWTMIYYNKSWFLRVRERKPGQKIIRKNSMIQGPCCLILSQNVVDVCRCHLFLYSLAWWDGFMWWFSGFHFDGLCLLPSVDDNHHFLNDDVNFPCLVTAPFPSMMPLPLKRLAKTPNVLKQQRVPTWTR